MPELRPGRCRDVLACVRAALLLCGPHRAPPLLWEQLVWSPTARVDSVHDALSALPISGPPSDCGANRACSPISETMTVETVAPSTQKGSEVPREVWSGHGQKMSLKSKTKMMAVTLAWQEGDWGGTWGATRDVRKQSLP